MFKISTKNCLDEDLTDPVRQLELAKDQDVQWIITHDDDKLQYRWWWTIWVDDERFYIIKKLHSTVHRTLIKRNLKWFAYLQDYLVVYRELRICPAEISLIPGASLNIQKFAFKYADMELKIKMINDPYIWNIEKYINSSDFQDNYDHISLGIEMGIL